MRHRTDASPARFWAGRGTQGVTTQQVEARRDGNTVRFSVRRVGAPAVEVALDAEEVEALRQWLDG